LLTGLPATPHGIMLARLSALSAQLNGAQRAMTTLLQRLPS
jgi:hypothetical protein